MRTGVCNKDVAINVLLTILGYVPVSSDAQLLERSIPRSCFDRLRLSHSCLLLCWSLLVCVVAGHHPCSVDLRDCAIDRAQPQLVSLGVLGCAQPSPLPPTLLLPRSLPRRTLSTAHVIQVFARPWRQQPSRQCVLMCSAVPQCHTQSRVISSLLRFRCTMCTGHRDVLWQLRHGCAPLSCCE